MMLHKLSKQYFILILFQFFNTWPFPLDLNLASGDVDIRRQSKMDLEMSKMFWLHNQNISSYGGYTGAVY